MAGIVKFGVISSLLEHKFAVKQLTCHLQRMQQREYLLLAKEQCFETKLHSYA